MVEQCGGQWNSGTLIVEQCGGKVEQCGGTVEQWNSHGGTVWWNSVVDSATVMAEHCCGTVEH